MTDVKSNKSNRIHTAADAKRLYTFAEGDAGGKIGMEVEMALYKPGAQKPQIPVAAEMLRMQVELKSKGHDAQLEASGVLEYASPPAALTDVPALAAQMKQDIATFEAAAARHGYSRAHFSILPTTTLEEAFDNRVPRERLDVAIRALTDTYGRSVLPIPLLTTGVQASFSPQSADDMFRMAHRGYALTPLLIAAMNSAVGYTENNETRKDIHMRSAYYEAYGNAAGIAESFLNASNAKEYIDNHIEAVFDTPMFFHYDDAGKMVPSTKDDLMTFRRLVDMGLNTQSNYELAESFIYNDMKICNLRNNDGQVIGKRLEVRAPDSGQHQPMSVLLMTAALIPPGPTAEAFDALLKDYGLTGDPRQDAVLLKEAHHAAVHHDGRFMDVVFGRDPETGAPRSLRDLAADVAGLIVNHYESEKTLMPDVSRLSDILLTGQCDAKVFSVTYPTLNHAVQHLQQGAVQPAAQPQNTPRQKLG